MRPSTKLHVPFTTPAMRVTRSPARPSCRPRITGTAPPTAASNRSGLPETRASETSSGPCSAITCLFAVTTARPARRAAAIHVRAGSTPPMSSTTTPARCASSVSMSSVQHTSGGTQGASRRAASGRLVHTATRRRAGCCPSHKSRATERPTVPKPAIATFNGWDAAVMREAPARCRGMPAAVRQRGRMPDRLRRMTRGTRTGTRGAFRPRTRDRTGPRRTPGGWHPAHARIRWTGTASNAASTRPAMPRPDANASPTAATSASPPRRVARHSGSSCAATRSPVSPSSTTIATLPSDTAVRCTGASARAHAPYTAASAAGRPAPSGSGTSNTERSVRLAMPAAGAARRIGPAVTVVPRPAGRCEFRMRTGMDASTAGRTVDGCSTFAPNRASAEASLNDRRSTARARPRMRGSAVSMPSTSVQI